MKKNIFGRKFNRDTNERKALFKSLISSLVLKERIKTTEAKAKAIKADVDKVITKVKKNKDRARRLLAGILNSEALEKLINDIAPRFKNRNGGYTRIIRIGRRFGDNAMEVLMEFTEGPSAITVTSAGSVQKSNKKPATAEAQKSTETRKKRKVVRKKLSVSK